MKRIIVSVLVISLTATIIIVPIAISNASDDKGNRVPYRTLTPNYTVPVGLVATYLDKLQSVTLPNNWEWVNKELDKTVGDAGNNFHSAIYTPVDTRFYIITSPVNVFVAQATPQTPVSPSGLNVFNGAQNMTLANIDLPSNWGWCVKQNQNIREIGVQNFYAVYTPVNSNFHTLRIPVQVNVDGFVYTSAGGAHTLAVDTLGRVWSWGQNTNSQTFPGGNAFPIWRPRIVQGLGNIISVSAGDRHSMALGKCGNVWVWGRNTNAEIGNGGQGGNVSAPFRIPLFENNPIKAISAGDRHSMALGRCGNVWSWGYRGQGRLGHGNNITGLQTTPMMIQNFENIEFINAGRIHSVAVDNLGRVWAWGSGANGQLGQVDTEDRNIPTMITLTNYGNQLIDIVKVDISHVHNIALDKYGRVWTWGNNAGHDTTAPISMRLPRMIQSTTYCGIDFSTIEFKSVSGSSSNFSMALDINGNVWTWGHLAGPGIGHGQSVPELTPRMITNARYYIGHPNFNNIDFTNVFITSINNGPDHFSATDSFGRVWTWGRAGLGDTGGRLGHGGITEEQIPRQINQVIG